MNALNQKLFTAMVFITIFSLSTSLSAFQLGATQESPYELTIYKKFRMPDDTYFIQIVWDYEGENGNTTGNNADQGEWTMGRDATQQGEYGDHILNGTPLMYYEIVFKTKPTAVQAIQAFSVKVLGEAIVLEDHTEIEADGIFLHIQGDDQSRTAQQIGFNDSLDYVTSVDRFSSKQQILEFYNELQTRLSVYKSLNAWENKLMYELNNTVLFPDADTCDQAVIDLMKSLTLHTQVNDKEDVLTILDDIFRAQMTFRANCPQ